MAIVFITQMMFWKPNFKEFQKISLKSRILWRTIHAHLLIVQRLEYDRKYKHNILILFCENVADCFDFFSWVGVSLNSNVTLTLLSLHGH